LRSKLSHPSIPIHRLPEIISSLRREFVRPLIDVPRSDKGQPVSGLQRRTHGAEDIGVAARQMSHGQGSPGLRDLGAEIGGGAARDGRLAGRIDVEQKKAVGEAQRGGKIGLEPGRPAKTVRLKTTTSRPVVRWRRLASSARISVG